MPLTDSGISTPGPQMVALFGDYSLSRVKIVTGIFESLKASLPVPLHFKMYLVS